MRPGVYAVMARTHIKLKREVVVVFELVAAPPPALHLGPELRRD
jgi:hypothetical protein